MTYAEILEHFGGLRKTAAALARPVQTVHTWKVRGVPMGAQYEIQVKTGAKLKASQP